MMYKILASLVVALLSVEPMWAMHIMEGYMPLGWCIFWYVVSLPFLIWSYRHIVMLIRRSPREQITFSLNVAFVFILSALKLPSVTGSSSHLTGTTLGTLTSGLMSMPLVGLVVLLFQSLLLAHGGISTLGANIFSLAIAGPLVAYLIYTLVLKIGGSRWLAVFIATVLGSLSTYVVTSLQLAMVFPDPTEGVWGAFMKFASIFSITQIPLSLVEGGLTVFIVRLMFFSGGMIKSDKMSVPQVIALSVMAILCLSLPILAGILDFGEGTDDKAGAMVHEIFPRYMPRNYFSPFEPSEALEPWLFTIQVIIGFSLFIWAIRAWRRQNRNY